jgi:divalent metal cation (Fe/Co/Zn/Cd) transporter
VVSIVLLAAKYQAYLLTGSTAILSDALESIVNVVAAVFALGGLLFAGRPADRNHPYGHGKIEFFSAAFEGGLIAFAAVVIIYEVVLACSVAGGPSPQWASRSRRRGPREPRPRLVSHPHRPGAARHARGRRPARSLGLLHQRGIVVGLPAVRLTGIPWLDPLVAAVVALNLMWTGARLCVTPPVGSWTRRTRPCSAASSMCSAATSRKA